VSALPEWPVAEAADAILVLSPATDGILYANEGGCRLLECELTELLALPISALYNEQSAQLHAFFADAIEYGQGWTRNLSPRTRGGRPFPAEHCALPIHRGSSSALVLLLVRDRSQHRTARA
jgi:hypothetical protein